MKNSQGVNNNNNNNNNNRRRRCLRILQEIANKMKETAFISFTEF